MDSCLLYAVLLLLGILATVLLYHMFVTRPSFFESYSVLKSHESVTEEQRINSTNQRSAFFHRFFNLAEEDMKNFIFDGYHFGFLFHPLSYQNVKELKLGGYRDTSYAKESVPHEKVWQHSRADGGPDLRYKSNSYKRISRVVSIYFFADKMKTLSIFTYPYPSYELSDSTKKYIEGAICCFNYFLFAKEIVDIEDLFNRFCTYQTEIKDLPKQTSDFQNQLQELNKALSAFHSISSQDLKEEFELKRQKMLQKRDELEMSLVSFDIKKGVVESKIADLVKEMRQKVSDQQSRRILESYNV